MTPKEIAKSAYASRHHSEEDDFLWWLEKLIREYGDARAAEERERAARITLLWQDRHVEAPTVIERAVSDAAAEIAAAILNPNLESP